MNPENPVGYRCLMREKSLWVGRDLRCFPVVRVRYQKSERQCRYHDSEKAKRELTIHGQPPSDSVAEGATNRCALAETSVAGKPFALIYFGGFLASAHFLLM
jgi:hypothetical protein